MITFICQPVAPRLALKRNDAGTLDRSVFMSPAPVTQGIRVGIGKGAVQRFHAVRARAAAVEKMAVKSAANVNLQLRRLDRMEALKTVPAELKHFLKEADASKP